jgi:hypothetical protein
MGIVLFLLLLHVHGKFLGYTGTAFLSFRNGFDFYSAMEQQ